MAQQKRSAVKMVVSGIGSYMNVWTPKAPMGQGDPKYSLALLIPKKDPQIAEIKKAVEVVALEQWGPGYKKMFADGTLKSPLRDGDAKEQEHYKGKMFFNCSSARRPGIVDKNREEIIDHEQLYSGCHIQVSVNFFSYTVPTKGVGVGLNNIRKIKDGEHLDGRVSAADEEWSEVEGETEESDSLLG